MPSIKYNIDGTDLTVVNQFNFDETIRSSLGYEPEDLDEAFYVCNIGDVLNKHKLWITNMPRVEPFYAIKCNPTPIIMQILSKLNLSFDCASRDEIALAFQYGVPSSKIIFANPCKGPCHIKYARENNVKLMTFDSIHELAKIKIYYPEAHLVLRIYVDTTKAVCPLGLKFGAEKEDLTEILQTCSHLSLNLVGVSFHVGSGCFDASAYETAIRRSKEVFDLAKNYNYNLNLLDIGGGFPGTLETYEECLFFKNVCETINSCLDFYFPPECNVRIIAEPGRYYVASAFQLVCSVTSIRTRRAHDSLVYGYFLNDGVYGSFNCTIFDHYIGKHYLLKDSDDNETFPTIFWGPTCDSMDKVLEGFKMRRLSIGDIIVFKSMGAYTMAAASNFNGFRIPQVKYFASAQDWECLSSLVEYSSDESVGFISVDSTEDAEIPSDEYLYISTRANAI